MSDARMILRVVAGILGLVAIVEGGIFSRFAIRSIDFI